MRFSTTAARTGGCWIGVISRLGIAAALGVTASAWGSTSITGPITSNTSWSASGSPYVLSGDVQVQNGARLDIGEGVVLQMSAGAGLTIASGTLVASGSVAQPIIVTSANASPQRGDWSQLKFANGASSASTLSHLFVRYGHGISIQSASPTFTDVSIENNIGAAITLLDLAAAPKGSGLDASGNDVNGILVPQGVIHGNAEWTVTGIPYVVQETIEVGSRPFGLVPSTLHVVSGQSAAFTVNIPTPAPAGGLVVALQSGTGSVVQVDTPVTIAEGEYSAQVLVHATGGITQVTSVSINASASPNFAGSATVVVDPLPSLQLQPAISTIGVNQTIQMTVSIPNALSSDVQVALGAVGSNIQVTPATVTIAHPATSATFAVKGLSASQTIATVHAQASGYNDASASVSVHELKLTTPSTVFVAPGASSHVTVSLGNDPAPAGGMTITIGNGNTTALLVGDPPPNQTQLTQVQVAQGATSVDVPINGLAEAVSPVALTFSATAAGYQPATTQVTVQRISANLGTGTPLTVVKGRSISVPVSLSRAAPPGGVTLSLVSSAPNVLSVTPATVSIPAGQTNALTQATLQGLDVADNAPIVMQATDAPGVDGFATVAVTRPARLYFGYQRTVLAKGFASGGYSTYLFCTGSDGGACNLPYDVEIALSSSDADHVTVPSSVVLPAGQHVVEFAAQGVEITQGDVEIVATTSTAGVDAPQDPLDVGVVQAQLRFSGIGTEARGIGEARRYASVSLFRGENGDIDIGNPGTVVALAVDNPIVDGLFAAATGGSPITQIQIPAGQIEAGFWVGTPTSAGDYHVTGTLQGVTWTSPSQHVAEAELKFNSQGLTLGLGLAAQHISVSYVANADLICNFSAPISFSSSDATKVTVESYSSEDGCYTGARIHGVALTNGQPVTITATAQGYPGLVAALAVNVEPTRVRFNNLDGHRFPDNGADSFSISFDGAGGGGPPSNYGDEFTTDGNRQLALAVTDATAGVLPVPALVGADTATIPQNSGSYGDFQVAPPTGIGQYHVAATVDGSPAGESELQTVGRVSMSIADNGRVGEGFIATVTLNYRDTTAPLPEMVVVNLINHAPGFVSIPDSEGAERTSVEMYPLQSTEVQFQITGEVASELLVAIDAQVEGDAAISDSIGVVVVKPTLIFDMPRARALNAPGESLTLYWHLGYPCNYDNQPDPTGPTECALEQTLAQEQVFTLTVEGDDPSIFQGFLNSQANPTDHVTILQGSIESDTVYADSPLHAGRYRIRATLGAQSWLSDEVVVAAPTVRLSLEQMTAGLHLSTEQLRVSQTVDVDGLWGVEHVDVATADEATVNLTCEPAAQCPVQLPCSAGPTACAPGTGMVVIPENWAPEGQVATVPIAGASLGTATIEAASAGLLSSMTTINVVEPTISLTLNPSPMNLSVGGPATTGDLTVAFRIPDSYWLPTPTQDIPISLASALPGVIGFEADASPVDSITVHAGQPSANLSIRALRAGQTAVVASGDGVETATSATIQVGN